MVWTLALVTLLPLAVGAAPVGGAASGGAGAETYTEGSIGVRIDDQDFEFDPAPYVVDPGRTMVPLRGFFESLGANVTWDDATKTVTGKRGDRTVQLTIGSRTAYVNGAPVNLEVAPELRLDRTFVPLRFVAESLDNSVDYNPDRRLISVWSRTTKVDRPLLTTGVRLRFRSQLVRLFLNQSWTVTIDRFIYPDRATFAVTHYTNAVADGTVRVSATALTAGRRFFPADFAKATEETAPWLSQAVFRDLAISGKAERVTLGGYSRSGQQETTLTVQGRTSLTVTMDGARTRLPVILAETPSGDRLWVLDDVTDPLVVKFQPVGVPMPDAFGTVGYQLESIESAP